VEGDAADLSVLEEAGLREASTVVVTTHDDDVNVYLTLYVRRLRPNVEVLARSNQDRNVATLYRAGADSVLSYASAGADAVWNIVRGDDATLLAEGLEMFRVHTPANLAGKSLAEADVARRTGCTVVAVVEATGDVVASPGAEYVLPADGALLLIGSSDAATAGAALARPRAAARQS
jgi:Trk K+ transport system NAD-binding subunit